MKARITSNTNGARAQTKKLLPVRVAVDLLLLGAAAGLRCISAPTPVLPRCAKLPPADPRLPERPPATAPAPARLLHWRPWTRQPPPVGRRCPWRPTLSGTAATSSASTSDCAARRRGPWGLRPTVAPGRRPPPQRCATARRAVWPPRSMAELPHHRRGPRQHVPRTLPPDIKVS